MQKRAIRIDSLYLAQLISTTVDGNMIGFYGKLFEEMPIIKLHSHTALYRHHFRLQTREFEVNLTGRDRDNARRTRLQSSLHTLV